MTCKRCRVAMKEIKGIRHGQRKFRCPVCGRVAMQRANARRKQAIKETP